MEADLFNWIVGGGAGGGGLALGMFLQQILYRRNGLGLADVSERLARIETKVDGLENRLNRMGDRTGASS